MYFTLARICLVLDALIFTMVGTFLFTDPAGLQYLNIDAASGLTAIRIWGGMFIGIGIVGLICALSKSRIQDGLYLLLIVGSAIVATRIYGIAVDGVDPRQLSELRDESLGPVLAILGLFFIWLHQRSSDNSDTENP